MDVVVWNAELLEIPPDCRARDPLFPQRGNRRSRRALGQLFAVLAEDEPVVDDLGRARAEGKEQPPVKILVGAVIEAAHDVRDAEVDVVHDAREVVGGRAVLAHERDAVEAVPERRAGFADIDPAARSDGRGPPPTRGRATPGRG